MSEKSGVFRWLWAGEAIRSGDAVALHGELGYRARPMEPAIGKATHSCPKGGEVRVEVRE